MSDAIDSSVLEDWMGEPLSEEKKRELSIEDQETPTKTSKYGGTD